MIETNKKLDIFKFQKLMMVTSSPVDGEALNALRIANKMLEDNDSNWEGFINDKIKFNIQPPKLDELESTKEQLRITKEELISSKERVKSIKEELVRTQQQLNIFAEYIRDEHIKTRNVHTRRRNEEVERETIADITMKELGRKLGQNYAKFWKYLFCN